MKHGRWILSGALVAAGATVLFRRSKWYPSFVDTTARKPSGWLGRRLYQDPKAHYKSFAYLMDKLQLTQDEVFLDICCGGGGLLERALSRVRRAAGIDHSVDMVALTKQNNPQAVAEGRLDVRQGDASSLPWDDATFDAVANSNALFFLAEPVKMFREAYRVLKPGGRFALVTTPKRKYVDVVLGLWSSSMTLYTDDALANMLHEAGFTGVEAYSINGMCQIGYGVKG